MSDRVVTAIFARGGSKGVPQKNLRMVRGESLLSRAIKCAFESGSDQVFVSTDDLEIAEEAKEAGATVPFLRPAELAADSAPEWLAWKHFCEFISSELPDRFSYLLVLPTTAPLRTASDVTGVKKMVLSDCWDVVVSMSEARHHPQFNLVRMKSNNEVERYDKPDEDVNRRQDSGEVFDLTTVAYAARIDFVLQAQNMWQGRTGGWIVPPERALDIDSELELEFAEFLLERRSGDED